MCDVAKRSLIMKNTVCKLAALTLSAAGAVSAAVMLPESNAAAERTLLGYYGDVNHDMEVNAADLVILSKYLLCTGSIAEECGYNADIDKDGKITSLDLAILRKLVTGTIEPIGIYSEEEPTTAPPETTTTPPETTTAPPETTTVPPETTTPEQKPDFISPSIAECGASLPSQGEANLVIFYVDFPDCKYDFDPTAEQIDEIAFGEEDTSDSNYPFDSMSAFYERSSKGAMNLGGKTFRYTTKENRSAYDTDKVKLAEECYEAFKDSVDFAQFDGDGDGMIDATLFTVPTSAGDDNWWPCAGGFGDPNYRVDGVSVGHIITGNAQIEAADNYKNFVSSYLHEMGHCMGLPDYYLYWGNDSEGMHGTAGIELMDTDATTDFGAFSKLMLGWYDSSQISVYDSSADSQTFTLKNAQTADGNCLIIPCGELDGQYFSEYFIVEYATAEGNNSSPAWWVNTGSGVRIYHINAELQRDYWYTYLKYQNGSEYNNDGVGTRLIRIVNDTDTDNFFHTGDTIDSSISGFGWYDSSENESIDPGVKITIDSLENDTYTVTVSKK